MTRPLVDVTDPAERARLGAATLPAVGRILTRWGLSAAQQTQLLDLPPGTDFAAPPVAFTEEQVLRMSLVVGMFNALGVLYQPQENADGFVTRPNGHPLFGGRTPLEVMLQGGQPAMLRVRRRLDALAAGHH